MTDPAPIILLGAARSGTKFLRDVLASDAGTTCVPYDINYVWRYGAPNAPHDRLDLTEMTPKTSTFIRSTIKTLAKPNPGDVTIEKTVSNTLRVPYVDAVYPNARYVHLIRDGRDVAESAMRLWQAPPDWSALITKLRQMPISNLGYAFWFAKNTANGLLSGRKAGKVWGPRFDGIDDVVENNSLATVCATQWKTSVETCLGDLARIPSDRVHTIRYEDLITTTDALADLITALKMPNPEAILDHWKGVLRPAPPRQWEALPDADRSAFDAVMGNTLSQLGYT